MALLTKKHPIDTLAEQQRELAAQQVAQQKATDDLITLLALQRRTETDRVPLYQAVQAAQTAEQEARATLARHIGKATESIYVAKHQEAEQTLRLTSQDLSSYDTTHDSAGAHNRIQELREHLAMIEQALQNVEQLARETRAARDREIAEREKVALTMLFHAYQDLLVVFEAQGTALATIRQYDSLRWTLLMRDLVLDEQTIHDLIIQDQGYAPGHRPMLIELQQLFKDRVAALKK